jgi:hypothetical protein
MRTEWLIIDVTAVRSLARAENGLFLEILSVFRTIQATIVVGQPLCDLETPPWGQKNLLRIIQ